MCLGLSINYTNLLFSMAHKHHICILEDDPFFAGLYARKFEARGWETSVVDDVHDVDACFDSGANLLVVDIDSDNGAAKDLIHDLKKTTSKYKTIPIVILTKQHDRTTVLEMMKKGVDAYLIKGHFVPSEAVEKVHRILDGRVL